MIAIGPRMLKTGLAVGLAVYLCSLLKIEPYVYAALSALVNMKPSVVQSLRNAVEQVGTQFIGMTIAFAIGLAIGANPVTIGLTTVLIIWTCLRVGWGTGIIMGVMAGLFVLTAPGEQYVSHAWVRVQAVLIGLFSALLVNRLIFPPRYEEKLKAKLAEVNQQVIGLYSEAIDRFINLEPIPVEELHNRAATARKKLQGAWDLLKLYAEQDRVLQANLTMGGSATVDRWEDYYRYNKGCLDKALEILEVVPRRLARRQAAGSPPPSPEFQAILGHLARGKEGVVAINQQLYRCLFEGAPLSWTDTGEEYWHLVSEAIDRWSARFAGSYYIHAFMEVAVVLNDLRWVAQTGKAILQEWASKGEEKQ